MHSDNYCVIMAGGIGSRFWPMSKSSKPKQFIDILGTGQTLIQQTYNRFKKIIPNENFLVVTNKQYFNLVKEQIPQLEDNQILLEPIRRNTAPCTAYASYKILKKNPNANIIVSPSDHLIINEELFINEIENGLRYITSNDVLLTLGIKPSRPETGYGYIQISKNIEFKEVGNLFEVKTFTEKPNEEMAKVFISTGEFYWNSGIFLWSLNSILNSFSEHLPEVNSLFKKGMKHYDTEHETSFINKTYSECPNISIDYGIMEKANNVYVLCEDFGWSDLGTWGSLFENSEKDEQNNVVDGGNTFLYDSNDCIIKMPKDKTVVIQGLEDYIVVESDNTLLICKKKTEQLIRQFVTDVNMSNKKETT